MVERRTWVNIAVRPCLHSFLAHNKHHLFENKGWEIYIKKSIRSLLKSSLSSWLFSRVYLYTRSIQYNRTRVLPHPKNVTWVWCGRENRFKCPDVIRLPGLCWKAASMNKQSCCKPMSFELHRLAFVPDGLKTWKRYCRLRFALTDILEPQEPSPPRFRPLLEGLGLLTGTWGAPLQGNADGARGIFGDAGRIWATGLRSDPP